MGPFNICRICIDGIFLISNIGNVCLLSLISWTKVDQFCRSVQRRVFGFINFLYCWPQDFWGPTASLYKINLTLLYYVELGMIGISACKLILYECFPKYADELSFRPFSCIIWILLFKIILYLF